MTEALPIGNGRFGGMIFRRCRSRHIQLTRTSLWTGDEKDTGNYQNFGDLFIDLGPRRASASAAITLRTARANASEASGRWLDRDQVGASKITAAKSSG